jgi:two-component system OmpR family response regulator
LDGLGGLGVILDALADLAAETGPLAHQRECALPSGSMVYMSKHVLIVDDDPHIREVIRFALEQAGMTVSEAANGEEGLRRIETLNPDLVILDIVMPEMDGLEMCRQLRKQSDLPVLFLSSRDEEIDRILGLELGGDDYLTKPFSPRELVARVNVIFRWLSRHPNTHPVSPSPVYQRGDIKLDAESHVASWQDQPVILTATEFALLEIFLRHPKRVYTRDDLIDSDIFRDIISDRTIDSHIRRLRQKFSEAGGNHVVETVHGVGYRLGTCQ